MNHSDYTAAACTGKEGLTPDRAQAVAKRMRRRDKAASAYRCNDCGMWHVGTKPGGMKGARPAYSSRVRAYLGKP